MRSFQSKSSLVWFYIRLFIILIIIGFPFFWMVLCSFKMNASLLQMKPDWFQNLTLDNYSHVLFKTDFFINLRNSIIISTCAVLSALLIGLPAAYSIARYKMNFLSSVIMVARMIPGISLLVPWFIIFRTLGLINTFASIIISHLILTLPMTVWIMISFIEDLPIELEEAALIDGCSHFRIFMSVVLPLIRTGIVTVSILGFIFSWNHFLFALILSGTDTQTLPVIVFKFMQFDEINYGGLYAAASLITMPILIIVFFVRNQFVAGLTVGSTKG